MSLTLAEAKRILVEAERQAEADGLAVSIVVLDAGGNLKAMSRMDRAPLSSVAVASAKAYSAVNWGRPTEATAELIPPATQACLMSIDHRLTFIKGGLPIAQDGQLVGGIGVSGATADQDKRCAEAGLAGLNRRDAEAQR